jgi:hypothetical protein
VIEIADLGSEVVTSFLIVADEGIGLGPERRLVDAVASEEG